MDRPTTESVSPPPAEPSALARRLIEPEARVALAELPQHWVTATVEATVPGHGALVGDLVILKRIRGAFGRMLMAGASREALAGKPCPWSPPCALDLLFREQARFGKHGIPKPWVLALDRRALDLVVRITLFGFAVDWAGVAAHALALALREHIAWKERAPGLFLPKPEVERLVIREVDGMLMPRLRASVLLDFVTPLDAAGDDPLDRPATVLGRLARRVDLLARWMGVEVDADWHALSQLWNDLAYDTASLAREHVQWRTGREHQEFARGLIKGALGIAGDLAPVWPLLVLGQSCHAGRAATAGLGRYALR